MKENLLISGNLAKDIYDGEEKYGGSAANLALAARRLGINVGIMSVLGNDDFSKRYRDYLLENGVDLSLTSQCLETLPVCEIMSKENSISSCLWEDNGCEQAMG